MVIYFIDQPAEPSFDRCNMVDSSSGVASLPTLDLPDPDEDYPDLTVEDSSDPTKFVKPDLKKGASVDVPHYFLGTLVVRVVAARDLEPVENGGLGRMVFGGNRMGRGNRRDSRGTANPYASVKFGNCTQRSSEVFDSLQPIWPRQETMFFDCCLPNAELKHPRPKEHSREDTASLPSTQDTATRSAYKKPPTVLTVALFHTPEIGRVNKYPTKGGILSGDSDDLFLGMAAVDLTCLFTGRDRTIDEWLPLTGTSENSRGSVRIVCEYESSDPPPRPGDFCRFTTYCHPKDLFPLEPGRQYRVAEVEGDNLLISYTSQEGWVCTFEAHRYMVVCEQRHHSAVESAQDELASLAERLSHSPLIHSFTETAERVAVDGLLHIGEDIVHGGFSLFNRWREGGVETILCDVNHVTNWDGRYNPDSSEGLDLPDMDEASDSNVAEKSETENHSIGTDEISNDGNEKVALPNMPCCPITGEPMVDPVVAADGTFSLLILISVSP